MEAAWRALRGLPRAVWLIGLISLVNDSASEMLYPLLPLYLASVLMAGPRVLGLIEGVAEATAALLKLFSGVVVDRTRSAKPWMVVGYAMAGFSRPLIAFVTSWPWLLAIRFADRVGKGLRSSPRDALLAASVDPSQRGLVFGLHRAMDNAGAVIGPLVAAALIAAQVPLRQIFLWSIVPAIATLLLSFALSEPRTSAPPQKHAPFDWNFTGLPPALRRYLVVVGLFTLGNSSNMFLLLHARELGVPEASIPLLWAGVSLVATLFSTPLAALSDRIGRMRLIVAGYVAYALFYLLFGLLGRADWTLYGLFAFFGLFMAATEGVEKALVADLAPVRARGTSFGWFNLVTGLFLLPASLIFGEIYDAGSARMAFLFSAGCASLATVLLVFWVRPGKAPPPAQA